MIDQHNNDIEYESIREKDIPKIAQMIARNFDGPFKKWQFLLEAYSVWTSTTQLEYRYRKFILGKERQHLMLVAKMKGEAIGYIEVGLIPLEKKRREQGETLLDTSWDQELPRDTMYPHIGNLVVDNEFRRKGIALSLMNQAINKSIEWGTTCVFCAVETDNTPASNLYINKLGFQVFLLEKKDESDFFNPLKQDRYILLKRIDNQKAETFSETKMMKSIEDSS